MTRNGKSYLQQRLVRRTAETGYSLWPTPRNSSAMSEDTQAIRERLNNGKEYKSRLEEAVALTMWPTPLSSDSHYRLQGNSQAANNLQAMAARGELEKMWPTPTTMDWLPPRSEEALERQQTNNRPGRTTPPTLKDAVAHPEMWPTPTAHPDNSNVNGKFKNPTLGDAVKLWPTMSSSGMGNTGSQQMLQAKVDNGTITDEEKRMMSAGNGGRLNPTWVEWLMGFPTGWTDLDA
jgi:DNA (cytosine-5)-methyltransferase 1